MSWVMVYVILIGRLPATSSALYVDRDACEAAGQAMQIEWTGENGAPLYRGHLCFATSLKEEKKP